MMFHHDSDSESEDDPDLVARERHIARATLAVAASREAMNSR